VDKARKRDEVEMMRMALNRWEKDKDMGRIARKKRTGV
jgi:hypothetical protein